jgi:hypothetical protein
MPRGADSAVTTPDWSIVFEPGGPAPLVTSAHDMTVAQLTLGQFVLTLGSGGADFDHAEISVAVEVGVGQAPEWSIDLIDNTHRGLSFQAVGAPVDPVRVKVAIRRLPRGGE